MATHLVRCALMISAMTTFSSSIAHAQFEARANINVVGFGAVPTESDYVSGVVTCENGAASFEALKAQAVAARTFAYYKMRLSGSIQNGTSDQVYSCSYATPRNIHRQAAAATEGEVLYIENFNGTPIPLASFYVAGAIPTGPYNANNPSAIPQPGDSDPTNTERYVTYPYEDGLARGDNLGTTLGFRGTPTNPNWPNRGAMSQNGSDYLSDNGLSYMDILKYYYGADIQLRTVTTEGTGVEFSRKTLTDFDNYTDRNGATYNGHEGYFHRSPTFSATTTANVAGSTAVRSSAEAQAGSHSQRIDIDYDETSGEDFVLRHVAGARLSDFNGNSNAAARVANLQFESIGSVGLWLKTTDPGLQVSLALDDPSTGERGILRDVIADGQWHEYTWYLENNNDWERWTGNGNGIIEGETVSIDSVQLFGSSDATVYLDTVFWDPSDSFDPTSLGDYNGDGVVNGADYTVWRDTFLDFVPEGTGADGDGNGFIGNDDYDIWRDNFGRVLQPGVTSQAIPEPAATLLLSLAAAAGCFARQF